MTVGQYIKILKAIATDAARIGREEDYKPTEAEINEIDLSFVFKTTPQEEGLLMLRGPRWLERRMGHLG
jgi:hypothetical protein